MVTSISCETFITVVRISVIGLSQQEHNTFPEGFRVADSMELGLH